MLMYFRDQLLSGIATLKSHEPDPLTTTLHFGKVDRTERKEIEGVLNTSNCASVLLRWHHSDDIIPQINLNIIQLFIQLLESRFI